MDSIVKRILIVDDEKPIRQSMSAYLEDCGFSVTSCETAEEAVEVIKGQAHDAAIIDMRLPGMGGAQFVRVAREVNPNMKCIIYTGSADSEIIPVLEEAQAKVDSIMRKPLGSLMELVDKIRELVDSPDD